MFLARKGFQDQDLGLTLCLGGCGGGNATFSGGGGGPSSPKPTTTTTTATTTATTPFKLNMMMVPSPTPFGFLQKLPWNTSTDSVGTILKGIDVNRRAGMDEEEAGTVSSPNSTISTVSGGIKRTGVERDQSATTVGPPGDDLDLGRASSRGMSDEEDGSDNSKKKLRLSKDQSVILEDSFKEHNTLNPKQKLALARRLGLRPRQVEVWFQNRRARTKLKQTEVDCEFLKRCCDQLTDENRRLQKEVAELRALKLSPQFYMQMTPPTTLTVCPSCEHAAVPHTPLDQAGPGSKPGLAHHQGVNPWLAAPVPIRPFESLQPTS